MDLQQQDGSFCPISIFEINKYLEGNAKNIVCSLYKMAVFIRQCKLENKAVEDIPQIVEFGFVAWDFISSIYKSRQDKLTACKDNISFRQCIVLQFKPKTQKIKTNKIKEFSNFGKQANKS